MQRSLCFCYLILVTIGILAIFRGPKYEKGHFEETEAELQETEEYEPTIKEMLFSKPFILLYVMHVFSIFSGYFVVNQTKVYGMENGLTND